MKFENEIKRSPNSTLAETLSFSTKKKEQGSFSAYQLMGQK